MKLYAIYSQTHSVEPALSEMETLLLRFPKAGTHGSGNYMFADSLSDAVNPLLLDDLVNEDDEPLSTDEMVFVVGREMVLAERVRAIHVSLSTLNALHRHPVWRVWIKPYSERSEFVSDWDSCRILFSSLPVDDGLRTYEEAATLLFTEISKL